MPFWAEQIVQQPIGRGCLISCSWAKSACDQSALRIIAALLAGSCPGDWLGSYAILGSGVEKIEDIRIHGILPKRRVGIVMSGELCFCCNLVYEPHSIVFAM